MFQHCRFPAGAILCLLLLCAARADGSGITANEIIAKVQSKYDDIETVIARFTRNIRYKVSRVEQESSGVISFKKKNKYRIETDQQTVVTDGVTSWVYSPRNNQVIINRYKQDDRSLSPEKLLFSYPKDFYSALVGEERLNKEETYVLKLTPKEENSMTSAIKVWINHDWLIKQVEVTDINKTVTRYTIRDIRIDKPIADTQFQFMPPAGADVVDLR